MRGRDRIVLMVLAVAAVAAAGWILVISPKKKEAKTYEEQVTQAQSQLSSAQGQLSNARAAESQYATAYSSVVNLGKAVPPSQEVASLVYELEQASNRRSVSFDSIVTGGSTSSSPATASTSTPSKASSSSPASASSAAGSAVGAGFTEMPFTFIFNGGFFSLEHLFHGLTGFTAHGSNGSLEVSGRLLTIQSVKLSPGSGGSARTPNLTGTVTATAYVLPASQGLTAGATPGSPVATATATGASGSPATAPAVVTP